VDRQAQGPPATAGSPEALAAEARQLDEDIAGLTRRMATAARAGTDPGGVALEAARRLTALAGKLAAARGCQYDHAARLRQLAALLAEAGHPGGPDTTGILGHLRPGIGLVIQIVRYREARQQERAAWRAREAEDEARWQESIATAEALGGILWHNWRTWNEDHFDGPKAYQVTNYWPLYSQRELHPGVAVQVMHRASGRHYTVHTRRTDVGRSWREVAGAPRGAVILARRKALALQYPEW
jgi:hypothetical protein